MKNAVPETLDWQALIDAQPLLACIPEVLRACARYRELAAGELLFRIGDPVTAVFLVVRGEVRLVRRERNGSEVILQRSRGGFFAEASLGSPAYHCDAVAAAKSAVIRFPGQSFQDALNEDVAFRTAWMRQLAAEVRKLRAQCERLSLNGAEARIVHYIESEGRDRAIRLQQSRKSWAAELGLSHEALYRSLRRLQDKGAIRIDGERIALAGKGEASALPRNQNSL